MNKIATVVGFFEETKGPQIQFDGEENPAEKEYPYLLSYTPKVDDKVFCLEFGESYIIIGKVNYQEEPFNLEEAIKPTKDGLANLKETHEKFETTYGNDKKQLDEKIKTLDTDVTSAVNVANEAKSTASSASSTASSAASTASSAASTASSASSTASSALSKANTAITTANNASSTASSAASTASDASRKAQNAESAATSAKTAADNAMSRANSAYDRNSFTRFSASGPIGFFGKSGASKRSVSTTSSTDGNSLKSKINEVIQALNSYGLL